MAKITLSVIVPVHNESESLLKFFAHTIPILDSVGNFEIVCIDDGSTDNSWQILTKLAKQDDRIKLVRFSRNFGKEAALSAGLDFAQGKAVIPIDADLQDPPELIPQMIDLWKKGYKSVLATRKTRDEPWLKRKSAEAFYALFGKFTTLKIPKNTGDFRLMDRDIVEVVKKMTERTRFMKGIFAWPGFKTATIYFDRPERFAGKTKWNYWKLWKFALDGIFSFTTLPLRVWTFIGGFISLLSFFYGIILIVRTALFGVDVPGYASLMVVVLFLGGIQLLSLGVIGEYIGRIYREAKNRPIYVVEETLGVGDGK